MATKKVVFITGANTGIGYQIVRGLCASDQPYHILLGGRSIEKAQKATEDAKAEFPQTASEVQPVQIDIEDEASIQASFDFIESTIGKLDALVNNAGASLDQQWASGELTTKALWTKSWGVNTVGTQVMTYTFIPLLLKSEDPRLLFLASGTSSLAITENSELFMNKAPPKGWPKNWAEGLNVSAYRSSKAGMNMMMREWHRILQNDGVKVWAISPGYLATGLGGSQQANQAAGAGDPATAGEFVREVLQGKRDADVGKVILREGVQPW